MSYTVGQQVVIPIEVRVDGVLTNATVTLAVTKPDGTVTNPTVGTTGTGLYSASVVADQPSLWGYVATISGAATGTQSGSFFATSSAARVISLKELKLQLNKDPALTEDDEELGDTIDAAQDLIVREYGPVIPTVYVERYDGCGSAIALRYRPVLNVVSVSRIVYGGSPVSIPSTGWNLEKGSGLLVRVGASGWPALWETGYQNIEVTQRSGENPIRQNVRLAAKELSAHLWRNTQIGRARRTRSGAEDEGAAAGLGYSLPYRVRELLGPRAPWVF